MSAHATIITHNDFCCKKQYAISICIHVANKSTLPLVYWCYTLLLNRLIHTPVEHILFPMIMQGDDSVVAMFVITVVMETAQKVVHGCLLPEKYVYWN